MPRPDGSSVLRRCICGPASVHEPEYSQLPQAVVPSSFNHAKPGNCCPALTDTFGWVGSLRSASALPLISFAPSPSEGFCGVTYDQVRFSIGSGNLPPFV